MACMPGWPAEAPALRALDGAVAVGLHVTLTDQRAVGPVPRLAPDGRLPRLIDLFKLCFSGRLDPRQVAVEVTRQLDAFEEHFGRPPDFVDGHQHVHLLPGIRQAVLGLFDHRLDPAKCWLRDCTDRPAAIIRRGSVPKAALIAMLGVPLALAARRRGIAGNHGFSGFYDAVRQPFSESLDRLLAGAESGHLLMVHPGHVDEALAACDSLTTPRQAEWETLMADNLPDRLASQGFVVAGPGIPG